MIAGKSRHSKKSGAVLASSEVAACRSLRIGDPAECLGLYRVNKADFMMLDSQMTIYKYELEYHQALTEYEKNVANLEAVIGKRFVQ